MSESPFSELINQWLEEGERISQLGDALPATLPPRPRRLRDVVARARAKLERHRGATFVFALTVSAFAIVVMRTFMHGVLAADAPVADAEPRPAAVFTTPATALLTAAVVPPPVAEVEAVASPPPSARTPEPAPEAPAEAFLPVAAPAAEESDAAPEAAAGDPLAACRRALHSERARKALLACRHASDANPDSAEAAVLLAHADLLVGRQDETLKHARRASTLDPRCAEAYLLIGNVQQMSGSTPAARAAYQAYLELAPRGPHAAEVRAILRTL